METYQPGSGGINSFASFPFSSYKAGWLEYVPEDTSKRYPCVIDAHGAGFTSHDPSMLNEGLAKYLNQGNKPNFVGICIAGGKVVQPMEFCNMIEYASQHPYVDPNKIIIGGLSYGAIHTWNTVVYSTASDRYGTYDILPFTNKLCGFYSLAGKVRNDYDKDLVERFPGIAECGNSDTVTKPSSIANLRDKCSTVIFHNYVGLGHGGGIWDRFWYGGNDNTLLTDWNGIESDPFMSFDNFLALCTGDVVSPPPDPEICEFTQEEICKLKEFAKTL